MRMSKLIFTTVCLVGLTQLVWSQSEHFSAPAKQSHGIAGFLDPRTGTFTTRAQGSSVMRDASEEPPTLTNILARYVFTFNIEYNDQPASATTACTVDISTSDESGLFYDESSTALATKSGTACTVTILFYWGLANPTADSVSVEYHIESFQAVALGGTSTPEVFRSADHTIAPLAVPSNGQTVDVPTITTAI